MAKELVFMCAQPSDLYYVWQVNLWLESLQEQGYSDKAEVIIYHDPRRGEPHKEWFNLFERYPEAKFFIYDDTDKCYNLFGIYVSILRPYVLKKHFKKFPELKDKAIFYCDCDIILTGKLDIEKYLSDEINYLSDTKDYINYDYLNSIGSLAHVKEDKWEEFQKRDIIAELAVISGTTKEVLIERKETAGGAQYLLKNVDAFFWERVFETTLGIRLQLMEANQYYMKGATAQEKENNGYQSWCADMWGVLHMLWALGAETKIVPELNFCHATTILSDMKDSVIIHNAGITSSGKIRARIGKERVEVECPAFYKGDYTDAGKYSHGSPFRNIQELQTIVDNEETAKYCTHLYTQKILKIYNKYQLNY